MNLKTIIEKRDLVDVKSSMRSLSDFDTIQHGDLHWTDRDCKYRLCNFTIGMKVIEAVKRGVDHGEQWVFYRLMKVDKQAGTLADATVANETPSDGLAAKPTKTQPPVGYRMLSKLSSDEPRFSDDLYWSLSAKDWIPIGFQMSYANRDNWAACRKAEETEKRYREPTLEDLKNGPIECEVRDLDGEPWKAGFLSGVCDSASLRFEGKTKVGIQERWEQCRIEVTQ